MHPINPKELVVFYIFQGLIKITRIILQNSRTVPGQVNFFLFQEFSRTKVKFKDFSRSVRTLSNLIEKIVCTSDYFYHGS